MKRFVWLGAIFFVLFGFVCCKKQTQGARNVVLYENDGSTENIVLENEFLELRFIPQTAEIILADKAKKTQWRSNPQGYATDPMADVVTKDMMESQFTLDYADVAGVGMTIYSGTQSVKPGAFSYKLVDGGLEVSYTAGNLARTYVVPPAVPEDRMLQYMEKMDSDQKSIVKASYRLYDINMLRSTDNRQELLSKYPDLARRKIYVLLENNQEWMNEQNEEIFADSGYTYDNYLEDISRYPLASESEKPAFNVTYHYALDGRSLVLTVPLDRIAYRPSYPVTQLSILPYMGAGGAGDQGYMLVPDGSGALIHFNNGRQNQNTYSNIVYGWDEAMFRDAVINDNKAPFPAFGIQKNGSALLCVIEEGAAYANVRADVSGRNSSWNNVYALFDMVHSATMDFTTRSERAVYQYEGGLPLGEKIVMRYTACESDGYVGMAKEYRTYLMKKYPSLTMQKETGVPIAVEIVGAVNKTQHRMGIPADLPLRLTSYKEAEGMINDFDGLGWKNVRIKLNGWFNHSVDHSVPTKVKLIRELGSKRNFRRMATAAKKNDYQVYPEADFFYMKDTKPFDGFSLYKDASRYVSRKRIEKYPFSFVWFGERIRWGKLSYVARPPFTMSMVDGFKKKTGKLGINNIAFRNMGATLAGDYNERRRISRESALQMRQQKLAELSAAGTGILLLSGHAYAAPWADFITDIAVDDQAFGITDETVPFYPMALHGLVPYTGGAINLAEDYTKNLLKTIESGAGLYFSFMKAETADLQETKFRQFYANEYDRWIGDADALYRQFSTDFAGLYAQAITNHVIVSPTLTLTEYEDGRRVLVNTGNSAAQYNGVVIEAENYKVLRQGE